MEVHLVFLLIELWVLGGTPQLRKADSQEQTSETTGLLCDRLSRKCSVLQNPIGMYPFYLVFISAL